MKKPIGFELFDRPMSTSAWRMDWTEASYWMIAEDWGEEGRSKRVQTDEWEGQEAEA